MTKQFEFIEFDVSDGIATIAFNRPDNLNTFNTSLMQSFVEALDECDADDAVRAVIVTGRGRAFCAGADLSQGGKTFDYDKQGSVRDRLKVNGVFRDWGGWMALRIFKSLKPVIGAINGPAAGVGATLQTSMDFRLASATAKFVFPFVRRGIVPEAASTWFLPRMVGIPTALDWCLTGRAVPATEALDKGFVRSMHPVDELMPAAIALAREIADNTAPVSVALTRQMIWRMAGASHPMDAHRVDSRGVMARGAQADAKEGIASFLEKRKPQFADRVSEDLPSIFPDWIEPEFS